MVLFITSSEKSLFERRAAGTGNNIQIVAANIDTVFLCMSLNADFNLRRMERYLSIAWRSMATPVIVLTKADLSKDLSFDLSEIAKISVGTDVVVCTSKEENGYDAILSYIKEGETVAFIGFGRWQVYSDQSPYWTRCFEYKRNKRGRQQGTPYYDASSAFGSSGRRNRH